MKCRPSLRSGTVSGAFSLIEVAVSVAVVSFAMVSILGVVPMGLTNFRQAMNNTVESQIVQTITSEERLTSFNNLQSASSTTNYFDAEGNTTNSSSAAVYTASVTTGNPVTTSTLPVNLTSYALMVNIAIVNKTQPYLTNSYSILVANQNN